MGSDQALAQRPWLFYQPRLPPDDHPAA